MKTIRCFIALFFASFFLISGLWAQPASCYVRLEDASGYTPTSEQVAELEAAAAELCTVFDSAGFTGQFKVYDFGFYLHQEVTEGGYPEPFAKKILEVQNLSPYYLLFGKQTDRSGVYTRFWVELKLPNSGIFSCLTENDRKLFKINLELSIKINYQQNLNLPFFYSESENYGIKTLKDFVVNQQDCCFQNKGGVGCTPLCLNANQIKLFFEEQKFIKNNVSVVISSSKLTKIYLKTAFSRVNDFSEFSIIENGQQRNLSDDANYLLNENISCFTQNNCRIFITKNENICDPDLFLDIQDDFAQNTFDLIGWIHIWQPNENSTEGVIYSKFKGQFYENTESYFELGSHHCPGIPYEAYLKIPSEYANKLNFEKVGENIEKLYKNKNGFRLNVLLQDKEPLSFFDLFQQISYNKRYPGQTDWDGVTGITIKEIDRVYIDLKSFEEHSGYTLKIDKKHGEYYIAYITAHEYLHQISFKSYKIILYPWEPTRYNDEVIPFDDGPHIGPVGNYNLLYPGPNIPNHHNGLYLPRYYNNASNKFENIDENLRNVIIRSYLSYALFYGTDPENSLSKLIVQEDKKWIKNLKFVLAQQFD